MKQLEVLILGQSYLLGCPDGGDARLLEAVERVDTAMCKIRDTGKVRARERIAVLAALNLAFDLGDQTPRAPVTVNTPEMTRTEAAQPMLKAVRGCLDQVSAQAIHPAALLRFEGAGQVTKLKIDAGGYDELACVEEARARGLRVGISRGASLRCVFRCN